jgi:hypothetical protein
MSMVSTFMDQFDEDGRYTGKDDVVAVTFVRGDRQFHGALHFSDGLCVRATMIGGGDWAYPDNIPLKGVHFLLYFEGEAPHGILVDDGRVVAQYDQGHRKS